MNLGGHIWLPKALQQQIYNYMAEKAPTEFKEDLEPLKKTFREDTAVDIMVAELYQYGKIFYGKD